MTIGAAPASARHRVLHLSDIHLTASGLDEDGVDALSSLRRILHDVRHEPELDVVVVSGDIADDGSVAGYERADAEIASFAAARGIPYVLCTGNHDDRANFAVVLGSGHRGPDGSDRGSLMTNTGYRAAVSDVNGLRVITLDSLVPGHVYGRIANAQLDWLRTVLSVPAVCGSVVVLHHPPISQPGHWMRDVVLQDPEPFAHALIGTDVHAVLCGHLHHQLAGLLGAVPVWVTPGVVTRIDPTSPPSLVRGVLGASATVIDFDGGRPIFRVMHARDPRAGEQVYLYDARSGASADSEDSAEPAAPRGTAKS